MEYISNVVIDTQSDTLIGTVPAKTGTIQPITLNKYSIIAEKVKEIIIISHGKNTMQGQVPVKIGAVKISTNELNTTTIFPVDKSPKQFWY